MRYLQEYTELLQGPNLVSLQARMKVLRGTFTAGRQRPCGRFDCFILNLGEPSSL
jgi:hypothetical protein